MNIKVELVHQRGLNEGDLVTQPRMKVMKFAVACQFLCLAALKLNEVGSPGATVANATWEVSQLIQRVQEADRDGTKKVLGDIVRMGGEKHLEEILQRFAAMGLTTACCCNGFPGH